MGCASDGCMYLHNPPLVNGVKLCKWCTAKPNGPQRNQKLTAQLQKDLPPREAAAPTVKKEQTDEPGDQRTDPWVEDAVFEVRVRVARGEGEDGCYHDYIRLYGEEAEQPKRTLGKEELGRRWIRIPALGGEGPSPGSSPLDPSGAPEVVVSVAQAMCPDSEDPKLRRTRMAGL